jgi:hypothetical protein
VFPGKFAAGAPSVAAVELPAWAYTSEPLLVLEREHLLRPSWQVVGYTAQPASVGAAKKRVTGNVRTAAQYRTYAFDGRRLDGSAPGDPTSLEMTPAGPLLLARSPQPDGAMRTLLAAGWPAEWPDLPSGRVAEIAVAANWKIVVEHWLESDSPQRHFLAPNQLLDLTAAGARLLQVVPEAADRSRLVCFELRAARGGGRRTTSGARGASPSIEQQAARAESIQRSLEASRRQGKGGAAIPAALAEFRRTVATLLPLLAQTKNSRS